MPDSTFSPRNTSTLRSGAGGVEVRCLVSVLQKGWTPFPMEIDERMEAAATEIERLREALREIRIISNGCEDSWDMLAKIEATADEVLTANS